LNNAIKIQRIKDLVLELNHHSELYHKHDRPAISDKQYDSMYDELEKLELETGTVLASSPTQKVQGHILEGLQKVKHFKPMLSAQKTKDISVIKKFVGDKRFYCSCKLDGLTLVATYENGELRQVTTRGNGDIGEDVTEQAKTITNLPLKIPRKDKLELRGECVISWENFRKINETLSEPYSHPRNLAAGSIRTLDTNITKNRNLDFIVFECITNLGLDSKWDILELVEEYGFITVARTTGTIENIIEKTKPEAWEYPADGLIFEFNSREYSESLGSTGHHENCKIAMKWADETYETTLRDVEWNTTKTGVINPVAIFDEVDLGGALTTRATLHNISIMEDLELGVGDTLTIYRANKVIPKVDDNLTRSNTLEIPTTCPNCGAPTEIKQDNNTKVLFCTNDNCPGKLLSKFVHFVSKPAMNIEGLSEATLEKFIKAGFLKTFIDIYSLNKHRNSIEKIDGFGKKSYEKLWSAIEQSKDVKLENFLVALGIPQIGRTAALSISKHFDGSWYQFFDSVMLDMFDFTQLSDFGNIMNDNIYKHFVGSEIFDSNESFSQHILLPGIMNFKTTQQPTNNTDSKIKGLNFVITGSVEHYKNRDELKVEIENLGGKVSGSVSSKTNYLINNDVSSTSGKNKKANELGVKIISEDDFIEMLKG